MQNGLMAEIDPSTTTLFAWARLTTYVVYVTNLIHEGPCHTTFGASSFIILRAMRMLISRQAQDVRRDDSIATATRRWPPGDCSHRDLGTVTALPALVALLVKFAMQRDEQGRHPR